LAEAAARESDATKPKRGEDVRSRLEKPKATSVTTPSPDTRGLDVNAKDGPVFRLATAAECVETQQSGEGPVADGSGIVVGESQPLAVIFEQYPRLRDCRGLGSMMDAWRQNPEKARAYAENAQKAGWPAVIRDENAQSRSSAGAAIWRALSRAASSSGNAGQNVADEEFRASRERAARAAEQRREAARLLTMKQLRAGTSTQAGRLAVAVLKAKEAEAAKADAAKKAAVVKGARKSAADASSWKLRALASEFGEERLNQVLLLFRQQVRQERGNREVVLDFDVLASFLTSERAAELDLAVAKVLAEEVEEASRTRWGKMLAALPASLVEGLLSVFQLEYGKEATRILSESWSRDLTLWEDLVRNLRSLGVSSSYSAVCESEDVMDCLRACLRAHTRLAAICHNDPVVASAPSDVETLAHLRTLGYEPGRGMVWTDKYVRGHPLMQYSANQCLADSLLQLLQRAGVLNRHISEAERIHSCAENRRRLLSHEDVALRPRRRCAATGVDEGEDPLAYLQHDVHAEPTVYFFLEWFRVKGKVLRELPVGGIRLTVFSRFDSAVGGRPVVQICERDVSEAPESMVRMSLYNLSGTGSGGYHYDPLFATDRVVAVANEADEVVERGRRA
jgi:hypothetical protein